MFQCQGCGVVLPGRSARLYCSNACQRNHERKQRTAAWLASGHAKPGSNQGHYVRIHILEEQGRACALCGLPDRWRGAPLVFVLDHMDGDADNNARNNLRLVCPNCDSQLPTYKSRNKGRGRHSRRTRYANGQSY